MIKFITEQEKTKQLTFGDVVINQFFVNADGYLCQKCWNKAYTIIALRGGEPHSNVEHCVRSDYQIQRILPKVTKIEF